MGFLDNLLGELFKFIYQFIENLGIGNQTVSSYAYTLIVMSLIYKLITLPFMLQSAKNVARQAQFQPELEKIKKKYGYDEQIYQQKMMEFQKENKMMQGMGSGCLTFIIQMIILFSLFNVIRDPRKYLEGFENISKSFLWVQDLSKADPTGWVLPAINSISQLLYQYLSTNKALQSSQQMSGMTTTLYIMPIMFFFIFRSLPAGLILYYTAGNVVEIFVRLIVKLVGIIKNRNKEQSVRG